MSETTPCVVCGFPESDVMHDVPHAHDAHEFIAVDMGRPAVRPATPDAEGPTLDERAAEMIAQAIERDAQAVSLGACFVGGGLDGASIYNVHKYAAKLVRDTVWSRAALAPAASSSPNPEGNRRE